ncbi:MAG: YitT family protein [Chloroflexi bacterium]|nr:YitT family protein [Chloroflexota bacterium]
MPAFLTLSSLHHFNRRVLLRTRWGNLTGRLLYHALLIVLGGLLMALSVDIFLDPNNVVPGGFTALAIFANRLWGWRIGITLLALNVPFLILGMKLLGVQFGPKTIFAAAVSSLAIDFLRPYVPTVQGEPLLYTLYGGLLYGLGMGLVFRADATSGGTEIPAKLLEHFRGVKMSSSLLAMDVAILALAAFFFGLAPALYALIATWVMARVIDFLEAGFNAGNTAFIVTGQPDAVCASIMEQLNRGVTILRGEGGYTGAERAMLFTAVNRRQVPILRELVSAADPDAFMVISPSNEVLGEGFKPLTRTRPVK